MITQTSSVARDQIISDYVRYKLSPNKAERDSISNRYEELQRILVDKTRTFQTGSYARFTSTTPVSDLDVIYKIPLPVLKTLAEAHIDPSRLDIRDILGSLADELRRPYQGIARIEVQPHSVGIYFGEDQEFSIDVVPAQPLANGMYLVPETAHRSVAKRREFYKTSPTLHWIKSDPEGYVAQAAALDKQTDGTFRRAAKFVKKWRHNCKLQDDMFPLKSFHLEIAMTELLKSQSTLTVSQAVITLLSLVASLMIRPQYRDRADANRYIDAYVNELTNDQKRIIADEQNRLAPLLSRFQASQSEGELLRLIEDILTGPTPSRAPGNTPAPSTRIVLAYSKPYRG